MSIRNRVKAFEEAAAATSSYQKLASHHSPRTSLTFSSDDALTAASSSAPASPKPSSVLDDLDSFVMTGTPSSSSSPSPSRPPIPAKPFARTAQAQASPLISFTSPTKSVKSAISDSTQTVIPMAPALPPRKKPSSPSLNHTNSTGIAPPPLPRRTTSSTASSGGSSRDPTPKSRSDAGVKPSDSLEAGLSRHNHASSTSSFQSLSLSDKDETTSTGVEEDTATISSAATSLSSHDAPQNKRSAPASVVRKAPPPVPHRPILRQSSGSSTSSGPTPKLPGFYTTPPIPQNLPYQARRVAPPPPSSARPSLPSSPAPSISSTHRKPPPPLPNVSATDLSAATLRPVPTPPPSARRRVPIPPPARARYEALFDLNLGKPSTDLLAPSAEYVGSGASRRRSPGWRGPSIDLRTNGMVDTSSLPESKSMLHGHVVRQIWMCSKLDKKALREIWVECDPKQTGWLDSEAFVIGMWRIDEELTRRSMPSKRNQASDSISRRSGSTVRR